MELEPGGELFDARLHGELGLASGVGANECDRSRATAFGLLAQGVGQKAKSNQAITQIAVETTVVKTVDWPPRPPTVR